MIEDIGHHFLIGRQYARAATYLIRLQLNTLLSLAHEIGVTVKIFNDALAGGVTAYRSAPRIGMAGVIFKRKG